MDKKDSSPGFGLKGWVIALGHGLAYVQHETDELVRWGFTQLKKSPPPVQNLSEPAKPGRIAKLLGIGKRGAVAGIRTLGVLGESYYERYEELKRKEK